MLGELFDNGDDDYEMADPTGAATAVAGQANYYKSKCLNLNLI